MTNELTPADIRACTGGNDSRGWGGDGAWWIIILFLFAFAGGWGNGGFGGGQGAANNYVLAYLTCNPNAPINYSVNYGNGCGCGC